MAVFAVVSKASLRPDPDEASAATAELATGDRVGNLRQLGDWAKVSFTDGNGVIHLGWIRTNLLQEVPTSSIKLYDEPFGEGKFLVGEITGERVKLAPWRKIRVLLADGSVTEGWVNDEELPPDPNEPEPEPEGIEELLLGVNEDYRPHLVEAEKRTEIDAAALAALINAEAAKLPSGQWNPNSKAGTSSAAGLTQFLDATWLEMARRTNSLLNEVCKAKGFMSSAGQVRAESGLLDLRFEPRLSIVTAAEYGAANLEALMKEGLVDPEIGDDEKARFIYIAHHEGLGGARIFLKKSGGYTFSDLTRQVGAAKAQRYVDAAGGDTAAAYRNWLNEYLDKQIQPAKYRSGGRTAAAAAGSDSKATLSQFDGAPVALPELSTKTQLAKAIQWQLSDLGYLDPPADGMFGPVSTWALSEFCDLNGVSLSDGFDRAVAQRLMAPTAQLPAIAKSGTWFDGVIAYMKAKKYFISRHPDCKNIVYLEGVNPDGTVNDDQPNKFNDLRIVFSVDKRGQVSFADTIWDGTTEPGEFWTINPMNSKGAARVEFNQYKAWVVGTHHPGSSSAHEALVQAEPITVYRDLNKDFRRPGDERDTGLFAINQHWGYDAPRENLGRTSAGCLVGRTKEGHKKFMSVIKSDPRYKVNRSYRFLTAVLPGDEVLRPSV